MIKIQIPQKEISIICSSFLNGELNRLILAASIDQEFCDLLLSDPEAAVEAGYGPDTFNFNADELHFLAMIIQQVTSLAEFANFVDRYSKFLQEIKEENQNHNGNGRSHNHYRNGNGIQRRNFTEYQA
jgi:hypothetical protein